MIVEIEDGDGSNMKGVNQSKLICIGDKEDEVVKNVGVDYVYKDRDGQLSDAKRGSVLTGGVLGKNGLVGKQASCGGLLTDPKEMTEKGRQEFDEIREEDGLNEMSGRQKNRQTLCQVEEKKEGLKFEDWDIDLLIRLSRDKNPEERNKQCKSYEKSNCCSKLCFSYVTDLLDSIIMSNFIMKDPMAFTVQEDNLREQKQAENFQASLRQAYSEAFKSKRNDQSDVQRQEQQGRIVWNCLWTQVRWEFWVCVLLTVIAEFLAIFVAFYFVILTTILNEKSEKIDFVKGINVVGVFGTSLLISTVLKNIYSYKGSIMALKMTKLLILARYDKIRQLSRRDIERVNVSRMMLGKIFSLENQLKNAAFCHAAPLMYLLGFGLIWYLSDWRQLLIAFIIFAAVLVIQLLLMLLQSSYSQSGAQKDQELSKKIWEMITGLLASKIHNSEEDQKEKIMEIRNTQKNFIFYEKLLYSLNFSVLGNSVGFIVVLGIILFLFYSGELFDSNKLIGLLAISTYLFLHIHRNTVTSILNYRSARKIVYESGLIFSIDDRRVDENEGELPHISILAGEYSLGLMASKELIGTKATKSENPILKQIDINLKKGDFLTISGRQGSGKSSLLYSILGETTKEKGQQSISGLIEIVEQRPQLFSGTVKDNILCGLEYREKNFQLALTSTLLDRECSQLPFGIDTDIEQLTSENSRRLQIKIALARSLYANSDIYLVDDVLSEFEIAEADELFEKYFLKALTSKCVVLISNRQKYIDESDQVLILKDGIQIFRGCTSDKISDEITQEMREIQREQAHFAQSFGDDQGVSVDQSRISQLQDQFLKQPVPIKQGLQLENVPKPNNTSFKLKRRQTKRVNAFMCQKTEGVSQSIPVENQFGNQLDKQPRQIKTKEKELLFRDILALMGLKGQICCFILILFFAFLFVLTYIFPAYWLHSWFGQTKENQSDLNYPMIFGLSIAVYIIMTFVLEIILIKLSQSGINYFYSMLIAKVIDAKIEVLDESNTIKIFLKFTQDFAEFDQLWTIMLLNVIPNQLKVYAIVIGIATVSPLYLVFFVVIIFIPLLALIFRYALPVYSVVYSHQQEKRQIFGQNNDNQIQQVAYIRSSGKSDFYRARYIDDLQKSVNASFCSVVTQKWISLRADLIFTIYMVVAVCASLINRDSYEGQMFVISFILALEVSTYFSNSLVSWSDLTRMVKQSKEIQEMADELVPADLRVKAGDSALVRQGWPQQTGSIIFKGVTSSQRESSGELSLNQISFEVKGGMRVGVVDGLDENNRNTMQNIVYSLLRLVEPVEGSIVVDGVNVKDVGLNLLRKTIAYIPRDPFFLQGTLREIIDPNNETPTSQLLSLLKEFHLMDKVNTLSNGIDTGLDQSMLTVQEQQLVFIARALVNKAKILFIELDDLSVETESGNFINDLVKRRFRNKIVFLITSKLDQAIDCDRILNFNEGRIVEFGHPFKLLVQKEEDQKITNTNGCFSKLVISTGVQNSRILFELAHFLYFNKNDFKDIVNNTLTILDNRTGKSYDIDLRQDMIPATALAKIKSMSGEPLKSFDPAYMNTVNCVSYVSYIDGDRGILEYRGFPIEQLAVKSTHLEVVFLLLYGQLPTRDQIINFETRIRSSYSYNPKLVGFIKTYQDTVSDAHPMGMLLNLISSLSSFNPETNPAYSGGKIAYVTQEERDYHIHKMVAAIPAIAAACLRVFNKQPIIEPDQNLGYIQNFLRMCFGPDDPRVHDKLVIDALDALFILHADHEQNCSTAAVRHMTSSLADVYVSLAGAVTALYGPRHGGANQAVLMMLQEIGDVANIPDFIEQVKQKKRLLMGFGHRIYRNFDPRAKIVKQIADKIFQTYERDKLLDVAIELERLALSDNYFIQRKLYPNVDFYSGIIYKAIGFPMEYMPVLFAVPRFSGWLAHWNEFLQDPDNKIVRPKQLYLGERSRDFINMQDRHSGNPDVSIAKYIQSDLSSIKEKISAEYVQSVIDDWTRHEAAKEKAEVQTKSEVDESDPNEIFVRPDYPYLDSSRLEKQSFLSIDDTLEDKKAVIIHKSVVTSFQNRQSAFPPPNQVDSTNPENRI